MQILICAISYNLLTGLYIIATHLFARVYFFYMLSALLCFLLLQLYFSFKLESYLEFYITLSYFESIRFHSDLAQLIIAYFDQMLLSADDKGPFKPCEANCMIKIAHSKHLLENLQRNTGIGDLTRHRQKTQKLLSVVNKGFACPSQRGCRLFCFTE